MKAFLIAITATALMLSSFGQDVSSANSAATNSSELNGTDLVAELNHSVNSKKAKLGDPVKATLTQDVLAHGKIVLRRGSRLLGYVTEAKARTKGDGESRLGMVFDKALLKGGQEIDFTALLRALAPPVRYSAVDKPDMMGPPMLGGLNGQSGPQAMSGPLGGTSMSHGSGSSINTGSGTQNQAAKAAQYSAAAFNPTTAEGGVMGGGSRGVFGIPGIKLGPAGRGQRGTVITSTNRDVKLDSGTQLVIQVTTPVR